MIFSLKKKKKILGGRKRSPGIKCVKGNYQGIFEKDTYRMGLSKETKKKVEEQMLKNIITDARKKGTL